MIIQKPIVDSFREVVANVEAAILPYLQSVDSRIQQVHYEHGHPLEIVNTLSEMSKMQASQVKKYPLVALFQDFSETRDGTGPYIKVKLTVIIANATDGRYVAQTRYEKNFRNILYPIYEELIRQIVKHPDFANTPSPEKIEHTKTDRLYWGRAGLNGNDKNMFNDRLDAIEINSLSLLVKQTSKCDLTTL